MERSSARVRATTGNSIAALITFRFASREWCAPRHFSVPAAKFITQIALILDAIANAAGDAAGEQARVASRAIGKLRPDSINAECQAGNALRYRYRTWRRSSLAIH